MNKNIRIIAYYLPQFHPIAENDKWWGPGFTEWTNVGKAKKLFPLHYQPRIPADLGYYDLRINEVRVKQAELAKKFGIEGFCYWHYWFGNGKQLLERPFQEVLETKSPDFPFCLAWANESWKGFSHGLKNREILIEQQYPGIKDYEMHFYKVLQAFQDSRYICIDGKPLFVIYKPLASHEIITFINTWRGLAIQNGLKGIYFVGILDKNIPLEEIMSTGIDAVNTIRLNDFLSKERSFGRIVIDKFVRSVKFLPMIYRYKTASRHFINEKIDSNAKVYPSIIPGWDHTPRSGYEGLVLIQGTPKQFREHVRKVINIVKNKKETDQVIFVKSWNEWAEGNYLEPDLKYGLKFLQVIEEETKSQLISRN